MQGKEKPVEDLLRALKERAKELNCLYEVEELFSKPTISLEDIFRGIVKAIPPGWQYADVCQARITFGDLTVQTPGFKPSPWMLSSNLVVQDIVVGELAVCYTEERPSADEGPFLKEERKLINTIADRLERRILHEKLKSVFEDQTRKKKETAGDWRVILDLLRKTDPKLLTRVTRKMLNRLSWAGNEDADRILERFSPGWKDDSRDTGLDENRPLPLTTAGDLLSFTEEIFAIAGNHLTEREILSDIQKWIKEDRSGFLVKLLENPVSSLAEIAGTIERFHHLSPQGLELSSAREQGFRISFIRRLLSDHPQFINIAKRFVGVNDFYELLRRIIFPAGSHGKLGGKGAGLFLATRILKRASQEHKDFKRIKTPKTWYLTSDNILNFINHNDLEEIVEQKYEDIGQVRQEYPYIVHVFKNSPLPPDIVNGLSVALDDLGETPLIVRSSSLLEDQMGTSFAGKYKSLFIANQGTKRERLIALMDAVTEVYASTFGPDPIEYRIEHGLVDFHEEMGIMIQEVVGTKVGHYYFPAFAGVAFTNNDLRWSKRIKREDGLLRMVPGLGTRAVDRLSDDYPILIAPGQPSLRVNVSLDEKIRYSPKKVDVINLKTNAFESVDIQTLLKEFGHEYPMLNNLVSILRHDHLEQPATRTFDPGDGHPVLTFEGLITRTGFVEQMNTILKILQAEYRMPVDLEFAHDGSDLYLLQCRPQSYAEASHPAVIPHDVPRERIVFSANRYVSNGTVTGISHVVYIDPQKYSELKSHSDLVAVGRAVSKLNELLPKRRFILMGPGRWGSRGDIKLGVSVTYSDINNAAMLIEIARKQRDYVPELSFGTHFFQDLVEASIRYLPLYPDDSGIVFNEEFLSASENLISHLAPEFSFLHHVIRVIDVAGAASGQTLQVLMNGELDEAVGILAEATVEPLIEVPQRSGVDRDVPKENHWRWRARMVEQLAADLKPERFGVKGLYLFGSTKNATAGPQSDIDLIVHFQGTEAQKAELLSWLEGWSLSLSYMNYLRTGYRTEGLLDVHMITDEDIKKRTSFAVKIGAATDAARPLQTGSAARL